MISKLMFEIQLTQNVTHDLWKLQTHTRSFAYLRTFIFQVEIFTTIDIDNIDKNCTETCVLLTCSSSWNVFWVK